MNGSAFSTIKVRFASSSGSVAGFRISAEISCEGGQEGVRRESGGGQKGVRVGCRFSSVSGPQSISAEISCQGGQKGVM
eukprot:1050281-Prorocentrum_minimum.AAC.1